jgi:hypothetical protein
MTAWGMAAVRKRPVHDPNAQGAVIPPRRGPGALTRPWAEALLHENAGLSERRRLGRASR